MISFENPALKAFVRQIHPELVMAQVLIRRKARHFELRHLENRQTDEDVLEPVPCDRLRAVAQLTEDGAFRPLKSAPNLPTGWRAVARSESELETALQQLYPGALADWHAARQPGMEFISFRQFAERQTGMYRIVRKLPDETAAQVTQACCHSSFCLKQRLWSCPGLEADPPSEKSIIPCLEPCALFLEFSRKAMRMEQEDPVQLHFSPSELQGLMAALERVLAEGAPQAKEADFNDAANLRRLRWLKLKLERLARPEVKAEEE